MLVSKWHHSQRHDSLQRQSMATSAVSPTKGTLHRVIMESRHSILSPTRMTRSRISKDRCAGLPCLWLLQEHHQQCSVLDYFCHSRCPVIRMHAPADAQLEDSSLHALTIEQVCACLSMSCPAHITSAFVLSVASPAVSPVVRIRITVSTTIMSSRLDAFLRSSTVLDGHVESAAASALQDVMFLALLLLDRWGWLSNAACVGISAAAAGAIIAL